MRIPFVLLLSYCSFSLLHNTKEHAEGKGERVNEICCAISFPKVGFEERKRSL
jgi:hypothetical protein